LTVSVDPHFGHSGILPPHGLEKAYRKIILLLIPSSRVLWMTETLQFLLNLIFILPSIIDGSPRIMGAQERPQSPSGLPDALGRLRGRELDAVPAALCTAAPAAGPSRERAPSGREKERTPVE
jgi:hypothetical protein